jgi:hypothetical protein
VLGSEFTTKAATLQGGSAEFVPSLRVVGLFVPVVSRAQVLVHEVLNVVPRPLPTANGGAHSASRELDRGAYADSRGTAQKLDLGLMPRPLPAAPLVERT